MADSEEKEVADDPIAILRTLRRKLPTPRAAELVVLMAVDVDAVCYHRHEYSCVREHSNNHHNYDPSAQSQPIHALAPAQTGVTEAQQHRGPPTSSHSHGNSQSRPE